MPGNLAHRKLASAAERLNARSPQAGRVPALVLMTDDERLPDPLSAARLLPRGAMVVVRARNDSRRRELADQLVTLGHSHGLKILIANDAPLAMRCGADGLHLSQANAHLAAHWRCLRPSWFITAAAHTLRAASRQRHADAIFLSPVFATKSHPAKPALSAVRANAIACLAQTPVYALGGITSRNAALLYGFAGIAAIGALSV